MHRFKAGNLRSFLGSSQGTLSNVHLHGACNDLGMVMEYLPPHHIPYHVFRQVLIDVQINWDLSWGIAGRVIQWGHVWVLEGLHHTNPLVGVKNEHLLQQIDRQRMGVGIEPG